MNLFDLFDDHLLAKIFNLCGSDAFQVFKSCRVFMHRNTEIEKTDGEKCWILFGRLHREDGPAFEDGYGDKEWWLNGKLHREDGPAIEWADVTKKWYKNGKKHRKDGPAIEYRDGSKCWYLNANATERLARPLNEKMVTKNGGEMAFLPKGVLIQNKNDSYM